MVERPTTSDRIQSSTSRVAFIGLVAATIMITASMIGAIQMQEASAARPELWCFPFEIDGQSDTHCNFGRETCNFFQNSSPFATGPCRPLNSFQ